MTNITEGIKERLSPALQDVLLEAGTLAREMGYRAYIVGGAVRDVLMGLQSLDVDIVAEGEGIRFARSLAGRLRARVKSYERFGTATLTFPDGTKVDIATARTETYERPAALPRVTPGSIRDDMFRRDFTVNAMAVSLMPGDFGRLLDDFGGYRDIRQRRIRALHERSFIDDPTRIFRAVRFEKRLDFRIVRSTEQWIAEALSRPLLEELEDYRIATELRLILGEPDPAGMLRRLSDLGIIERLKGRPAREKELEVQLKKVLRVVGQGQD
ncbi:MAG: CCA tRNA nucleotidyltransferase [Syntrophaceae bacterium]